MLAPMSNSNANGAASLDSESGFDFPFYHLVPKETGAHARYCLRVRQLSVRDDRFRAILLEMCKRDCLFFINTMLFVYEPRPRKGRPHRMPFNTWAIQDQVVKAILDRFGQQDIGIAKSRDMGMSWIILAVFFWFWMFHRDTSFLIASRKEDYVDAVGNPGTLFWKLDKMREALPSWMAPELCKSDRSHMHMYNPTTGSVIDGESTNGDLGRGDRRTGMLFDEAAAVKPADSRAVAQATQAATRMRIWLSTYQGTAGEFYDVMRNEHRASEVHRITVMWYDHPDYRRGLYTSRNGELEVVDKDYEYPENFDFVLDGQLRSPWFDAECRRCGYNRVLIAQELMCDPEGSGGMAFDRELLDKAIAKHALPPLKIGEIGYDPLTGDPEGFYETRSGRLKLWRELNAWGSLDNTRRYAAGVDPAMGTTTAGSQSVCVLYDLDTAEKVATLACRGVDPKAFALMCVAICRWAKGRNDEPAFLIWEDNGPGMQFRDEVLRLGYSRIYYRRNENVQTGGYTDIPGWWSTTDTKKRLLAEYQRALGADEIINHDREAIGQCAQYVIDANNGWVHSASKENLDPSASKDNHGDHVIADAVVWHAMRAMRGPLLKQSENEAPVGSFAWRRNLTKSEAARRQLAHSW